MGLEWKTLGNALLPRLAHPSRKASSRDQREHQPNGDPVAKPLGTAQLLPRVYRVFPGRRHSCNALVRTWALVEWTLWIQQRPDHRGQVAPKHKHDRNDSRHCWARCAMLVRNEFGPHPVFLSPLKALPD